MAFYVKIKKIHEDSRSANYSFWSDPARMGFLNFDKISGEIKLVEPAADDSQGRVFMRAAMKLKREWEGGGCLPQVAEWAS